MHHYPLCLNFSQINNVWEPSPSVAHSEGSLAVPVGHRSTWEEGEYCHSWHLSRFSTWRPRTKQPIKFFSACRESNGGFPGQGWNMLLESAAEYNKAASNPTRYMQRFRCQEVPVQKCQLRTLDIIITLQSPTVTPIHQMQVTPAVGHFLPVINQFCSQGIAREVAVGTISATF